MRAITGIIIHCAATRPEWMQGRPVAEAIAEIRRWHQDRGWSDIGYHFVINREGEIGEGRDIAKTGAHVQGHNTGTIGVCLLGGHGSAETDSFADNFTPEQDEALRGLLGKLRANYGPVPVTGHNEYAAKACPGFQVREWLAEPPSPDEIIQLQPKPDPSWWTTFLRKLDEAKAGR